MKVNYASLSIELNVECPNLECDEYFDLFDIKELTEEGFLYNIVFPKNDHWGCKNLQQHLDLNGIELHCPKCKTKIEVEEVEW